MKRIFGLLLVLLLVTPAFGIKTFASNTVKAAVTGSSTYFDGEEKSSNGFNIAGSNYFNLRDLARNFSGTPSQFNITWNPGNQAIEIETGKAYSPEGTEDSIYFSRSRTYTATLSTSKVMVDGVMQSIKAYNIEGNTYFQLRDLADKIPFELSYDSQQNRLVMFSRTPDNAYRAAVSGEVEGNAESSYFPRWKSTVSSYLVNNSDGTVSVVEAGKQITIDTYNAKYELAATQKIDYELPLFGGFYSGAQYNYIAFGQENREENDNKEVIRIVRYDKSFKRKDSVSITGGQSYTVEPFDAGSGRMAESGDTLVFHTSRTRYTTEDKLNHQSQLTIIVNTSNMKVTNDLGRFQKNHVSHSFDQYVLFDGGSQVLVDHGNAYPRSVVLHKGNGMSYNEVDLLKIPGRIGANATGVSIGGVEMSSSSYIAAMNTVDHSLVKDYTSYEMVGLERDQRDIILSVLPKNSINNSSVHTVTLAKYVGTDQIASIPKLVRISDDQMMVLWQEFDTENRPGDVKYVLIDGNGKATGNVQTIKNFMLSECKPVVSGGNVVWYTNGNGSRMFYTIPVK
ncbi:hypothetical protein QYF50_01920 [Paenibacillus vini]|uniref:hypothetical protein n=1 Tax=Paenibacillus vini TaxID=1476024 RepID=UPI0025B6A177|nr:hypothetical protein [Paenibacillus vini]MDN4066638.1 hypothetical protein [Paenibacillus vini]